MSGVISSFGASNTPAMPAIAEARPQTVMRMVLTGMPMSAAARGFWLVARIALPIMVWRKNTQSAAMMTTVTPMMARSCACSTTSPRKMGGAWKSGGRRRTSSV